MAQLSITAKSGVGSQTRPQYPNWESETVWYSGKYEVYKDGQYIGSHNFPPADITFFINNFRLERTDTFDDAPYYRNQFRNRIYKFEVVINYPDEWLNVGIKLYFNQTWPNNNNPQPATLESGAGSVSPKMFLNFDVAGNYYFNFNAKLWPTQGTIDEEGLVTYPQSQVIPSAYNMTTQTYEPVTETPRWAEGQQNKSIVDAVLSHLLWDWGDGTVDTIPLSNTEKVTGSTYVPAGDGSGTGEYVPSDWVTVGTITAPVTHKYVPDENGDGTGKPIKLIAVDSVGRKSAPVYSKVGPHLEVEKSIDESTNRMVLDSRKSYGRTGKITTKVYRGNANYEENKVDADLTLDEEGRVWGIPLNLAGLHSHYAYAKDDVYDPAYNNVYYYEGGYSAFEPDILNQPTGGRDDYRFEQLKWQIERPPQSSLPLPDGATLLATEYEKAIEPPYIDDDTPRGAYTFRGQTMLRFILDNKGAAPEFEDATAPRLFRDGATFYLAGRAESGATKLWRSQIRAKTWSEMSTIWTPDFYHADVVGLIGGGAASVAVKRVPGTYEYTRDVEFWFRKTFDLSEWEEEPVKIATYGNPGLSLDETLSFYPLLINESLAGRAPRLIAILSFLNYRSSDLGANWERFAT